MLWSSVMRGNISHQSTCYSRWGQNINGCLLLYNPESNAVHKLCKAELNRWERHNELRVISCSESEVKILQFWQLNILSFPTFTGPVLLVGQTEYDYWQQRIHWKVLWTIYGSNKPKRMYVRESQRKRKKIRGRGREYLVDALQWSARVEERGVTPRRWRNSTPCLEC